MIVLERGKTPDNIDVQIEDWSSDYDFHRFGDVVAIYPVAIHTADNQLQYPRFKETFRIEFDCEDYEQAREVFENLKNGTKNIRDYENLIYRKEYLEFI